MNTRLHRFLGAAALGGGLLFLWTGTAGAEPDVNVSDTTIDVDDVLGGPDPTVDATLPVGVEALLGGNDVVVGDPTAPVAAEGVTSDPPDPTVVTPPAAADAAVADSTASVAAPVATVDPDVVVCGNAVGVLGDAAAGCDPAADSGTTGTTAEAGSIEVALGDRSPLPGTTLDGEPPELVADPDVLVCGNAVGVAGDATGSCAPDAEPAPVADAGSLDLVLGGGTPVSGTTLDSDLPGVVADPDVVACGNGVGVVGAAGGACAPGLAATPVAGPGSLDLALGGTTPVAGSTLTGEVPGVVAAPDAMACGNGAGILGSGSGSCTSAMAEEPLSRVDTFALDLEVGGTTPLAGSSAVVDLSSTALDPDATACGNGVGVLGDGSGTCGDAGSPVPAVPVDQQGTVAVVVDLGDLTPLPVLPALPTGPLGDLTPLPVAPPGGGDDGTIGIGPIALGGLGNAVTPVDPGPTPVPPARPGLGIDGSLAPIRSGGTGGFGAIVPLGTVAGDGPADLPAAGSTSADLSAAGSTSADLWTGAAGAALAFTGFGIRNALSFASVLLALGALLLAGRRRVELLHLVP